MMLVFLDYFFLWFHTFLILVNVFGWIWSKTRRLQIVVLGLTLFSWIVMGYFYGWGYCLLTDWHWDVLTELGNRPVQSVYVQYLVNRWYGWEISRLLSDVLTITGLLVGLIGAASMRWIVPFFRGNKDES
jgi:hypothetical protein